MPESTKYIPSFIRAMKRGAPKGCKCKWCRMPVQNDRSAGMLMGFEANSGRK